MSEPRPPISGLLGAVSTQQQRSRGTWENFADQLEQFIPPELRAQTIGELLTVIPEYSFASMPRYASERLPLPRSGGEWRSTSPAPTEILGNLVRTFAEKIGASRYGQQDVGRAVQSLAGLTGIGGLADLAYHNSQGNLGEAAWAAPAILPGAGGVLSKLARGAVREVAPVARAGHNLPPTGSMNPLAEVPVTFRGMEPKDFSPADWQAFGQHYGVNNMGPLSPPQAYKTTTGEAFNLPGGTEGTWTYADLLNMKANPINTANVDRALHTEMQKKLGRTMTPNELSDADVWNGLMFGMTSPNNPLVPNQLTASRLRLRTPEMLDDLASMIPWKAGDQVPKEVRQAADRRIAQRFGLNAAPEGLGSRGTTDYTRVAELAQMFKQNPEFFRKKPDEDWGQAVERISSQVPGLSMKTGSFGTVWQDPYNAAISAIDRHMARELDKRGGIFVSPEERTVWENSQVKSWNKANPDKPVETWTDLTKQSGSDGFIGEKLLDYVGAAGSPALRTAKGGINPNVPPHLQKADWVVEPKQVSVMGAAYKRALAENQKAADEHGLNLFMSQWMEWDRIRNRFEPHENMFPGLSNLPAMSKEQLRAVDKAYAQTGHKTYGKSDEGTLQPTRPYAGNASQLGYLGIGGLSLGSIFNGEDR